MIKLLIRVLRDYEIVNDKIPSKINGKIQYECKYRAISHYILLLFFNQNVFLIY